MKRPEGIRGPEPIMTAEQIVTVRARLAIRTRALAIARKHSDKRIARDLGIPPRLVPRVRDPSLYKWAR